jgi:transposase
MDHATLIAIDPGKHCFRLHGQDANGKAVFRKKLGRKQLIEFLAAFKACTVVMEACADSHHMAREVTTFGHEVKLISPQFVRPFVKSNKNDFVDAEAICEAASRPAMRFVTPKTESQQTGGKVNLLGICRRGDKNVRRLLVLAPESTCVAGQAHGKDKAACHGFSGKFRRLGTTGRLP